MKRRVRLLSMLLTVSIMVSILVPSFIVAEAKPGSDGLQRGSYYQLVNKKTGKYLTETQDNTFDPPYDTRRVVLDEQDESDAQLWEILDRADSMVSIISKTTNKSLHKSARVDSRLPGQSYCVITNTTSASPQQYWRLISAGNGYFKLQNPYVSTEYLAATEFESEQFPGTLDLTAAPEAQNDDAQLWKFVKVPDEPIPDNNVEPLPGYPLDERQILPQIIPTEFTRVPDVDVSIDGYLGDAMDFIHDGQIKGANWKFLVDQFRFKTDYVGNTWQNWRGEFWGKIMRGACWFYQYSRDEELYSQLERTVRDILSTQEENGRISSFPLDEEFTAKGNNSFDIWNRKYVMLGLEYFLEICKDQELSDYIVRNMCISADYIIDKVGPNPGQISILEPIDTLGGVSTSSILEPFVYLYKITGYQRYLDFCDYIIECGGSSKVNVIEAAIQNEKSPFQYANGSGHAYANTSLFEGLAEYAMLTGNETYMQAVKNYAAWVIKDEITILGAGSINEHWANTALSQDTPYVEGLQETCISVTWLKFCEKMLKITGDPIYADQMEKTTFNAMLAAMQGPQADVHDSCSAIYWDYFSQYNGTRHHEYGGHIIGVDSCCSASGPSGLAIVPFAQVMNSASGPVVNLYNPGSMTANAPSGQKVKFDVQTNYPVDGDIAMTVQPEAQEQFTIKLRIPAWSEQTVVMVNGEEIKDVASGAYLDVNRVWKAGDTIEIVMDMRTRIVESPKGKGSPTEGNIALLRGPVVLARDARFDDGAMTDGSNLKLDADGFVDVTPAETKTFTNNMEFVVHKTDGSSFRVTDYPSAGNNWTSPYATCLNKVEPVKLQDGKEYFLYNVTNHEFVTLNEESKTLYREKSVSVDNGLQCWTLEASGDSFHLKNTGTGEYMTIAGNSNGAAITAQPSASDNSLWNMVNKTPDTFLIAAVNGGRLLSGSGDSNGIHLWENGNSPLQVFKFIEKQAANPLLLKEGAEYRISCQDDSQIVTVDEATGTVYRNADQTANPKLQAWTIEFDGASAYLKNTATGQYLKMAGTANGSSIFVGDGKADGARWKVNNLLSNRFTVGEAETGALMSSAGAQVNTIHMWSDTGGADMQVWRFTEIAPEPPAPDKTGLEALYAEWKDVNLDLYADGLAKENFIAARGAAKEALDNPDATQEMIDQAATNLRVTSGLLEFKPVSGDKTILKKVIDYANAQKKEGGEYHSAIPSVQASYDAALAHAERVYADPTAGGTAIDDAWTALLKEIHKLGFVAGDKTQLVADYELYSDLDLSLYVDGAEKDAFKEALAAAKAVIDDLDAMQAEITDADEQLVHAAKALVLNTADKEPLETTVAEANTIYTNFDNYVTAGKDAFTAALEQANAVLGDPSATQTMINDAVSALINAMMDLRLKADKTLLQKAVAEANAIDLSNYTATSVERFLSEKAKADGMLADDELSVERQNDVVAQVKSLQNAMDALDPAVPVNGDSTATTSPVKTGDSAAFPFALAAGLAALACAGYAVNKRRK